MPRRREICRCADSAETLVRGMCRNCYMLAWLSKKTDWAEERRLKRARPKAERKRRAALKSSYGITLENYNFLNTVQSGRCAICGGPPKGKAVLSVDHDHKTGSVRGLLCGPCNIGLGQMQDDAARLRRAAEYIEDYADFTGAMLWMSRHSERLGYTGGEVATWYSGLARMRAQIRL